MSKDIVFSFKHAPTLKAFNANRQRIRAVTGPFGCLSCDTEYLTVNGWKRFDVFSEKDEIAEFDLSTSRISFKKPLQYIKLPCDSFLHLKNRYGIDQLLSDEHTVLFNTRFKPEEWKTITALELTEAHNSLKDGWSGRIPTTFRAPATKGIALTDDELRLQVAISADGSFAKRGIKCNFTVRKERKKERLKNLLAKCGIKWTEHIHLKRPTEVTFRFYPPERNKDLWKYFSANEHQLAVIADEFVYWDGHKDKYGGRIFSSTEQRNADMIQYALAATGIRATYKKVMDERNSNWKAYYYLYANKGATFLSMRQAPKIERVKSEDGFKYCFTTSTGFFIARRNGRIFVTGNSGKSSACVIDLWEQACNQAPNSDGVRRTRFAIIRSTYRQLFDTTRVTVLEWLPEAYFGRFIKNDNVYYINVRLPDGTTVDSEWLFRALDKPEHVRNLLSLEVSSAWINEYKETPKVIFDAIDGRIGRFPPKKEEGCTYECIIMDTNPPDYDHWAYKLFEEQIHENADLAKKMVLFKQPSGLSPKAENLPFLPKDYYKNLVVGKDKDWIRVFIDGDYGYVKSGQPVYQNYSDQMHVAPKDLEPIRGIPIIIGMDFASCPSAIICQGLPSGRFNVLREVIGYHGQVVRTFLADVLRPVVSSYYSGFRILVVGDPSGINTSTSDGSTCFKELRAAGFKAIKAKTNAIQARLAAVDSLLTSMVKEKDDENLVPKLQLSPSLTPVLRKGFMGEYKYREAHSQFGVIIAPTPMKNEYADAHDGLQYAALGYEKIHMAENADYEAKSRDNSTTARHSHEQVKSALY